MHLIIVDPTPNTRAALAGRVQEAIRQSAVRRMRVLGTELSTMAEMDWSLVLGCLVGPGCYDKLEEVITKLQSLYQGPIGVVLEAEIYAAEAIFIRKRHNVEAMSLSDMGQLAGFLINCESKSAEGGSSRKNRGVVSLCQFKGGVGSTTLTAALGACWAKHGLNVCLVDLDDVNPQLTAWARVGTAQRKIAAEFLRHGAVPTGRVNELLSPIEGFGGKLSVVGQPVAYNEAFHFKASVMEAAPPANEFMFSLFEALRKEFDVILIDLGRSWGVASFATLPLSQFVILVTDDDAMSVRRSLDGVARLKAESDDAEEFDLSRWSIVLNAHTGHLISPTEMEREVRAMELFPPQSSLYAVPFSVAGRQWGAPGKTFYDLAEPRTRKILREIAFSMIPFRYQREDGFFSRVRGIFSRK